MKHLITAAAIGLALPAYAQDEKATQDHLSERMAQQGYVPVSLFMDSLEICEGLLKDFGDSDAVSRLGMEYCGAMLFSAMSVALEHRVGEAPPFDPHEDAEIEPLYQDVEALRVQLARALTAKLAAETLAQNTATLLAAARQSLSEEEAASAALQRQTELLNLQVAALRTQLGDLQALLDNAVARDAAKSVQLKALGSDLNTALARVAAEQSRRAKLEAAESARLEAAD